MLFQVRIQNLGKLADATVRVSPLTVLAGVNNTGKTFFSKFLYSVLDAVNSPLVARHVDALAAPLTSNLERVKNAGLEKKESAQILDTLTNDYVRGLGGAARSVKPGNARIETADPYFTQTVEATVSIFNRIRGDIEQMAQEGKIRQSEMDDMDEKIRALSDLTKETAESVAIRALCGAISDIVCLNFQASQLADVQRKAEDVISGEVSGFGGFQIPERVSPGLLELGRRYPKAFYLESSAWWRLKDPLETLMLDWHFRGSNGRQNVGVPEYFYRLTSALRERFYASGYFPSHTSGLSRPVRVPLESLPDQLPFEDVALRLTNEVIGGKIEQDGVGKLLFVESSGEKRALPMTATGVVNLGILALLIERKILDKGTFLFIDEPEANLHPAWQVEMIRALLELARGGVNVVLATHSVDIVKYLDVHLQEHPELKELVELNHFTREGVVGGDKDFGERMDDIMLSLTDPFHKLRLDEIRASWSPS